MKTQDTVKVWDPLVRVFHWSLVVFFIIAWVSAEESEDIHELAGYAVLGLLVFRIVWGFAGSHYARFHSFIYGPERVRHYLQGFMRARPPHYYGHNPAGGWAVVVMLVLLAAISFTGLQLEQLEESHASASVSLVAAAHADEDEHGEEYEYEESEAHELWEELHEFFSNFMLAIVFFHVAAVLISGGLHEENLVKAMFTGRKRRVEHSED